MTNAIPRRPLFKLAALLTLVGCTWSTLPDSGPDEFDLRSIDGRHLPTSATSAPGASSVTILSEQLNLATDGTATRNRMVQGPTPSTPYLSHARFAYSLVDGVVTLGEQLCAPNELCPMHVPEQGRITDGNLPLAALGATAGASPVFLYQRYKPD